MGKRYALVLSVSVYDNQSALPACETDRAAMDTLFRAAGKFDEVVTLSGERTYAALKGQLADFFRSHVADDVDELVFYFSGHGGIIDDDFRFVLRDFDANKPNSTSISNSELDALARSINPRLYCKIVDACHAGMSYIKDSDGLKNLLDKGRGSFRNCYFFYSSQQDQNSFADDHLSRFTRALVQTVVNFPESTLGYNDLASELADHFRLADRQTPYFVSQGNLTETFVEITASMRESLMAVLPPKQPLPASGMGPARNVPTPEKGSLTERVKANAEPYFEKPEALDILEKIRTAAEKASLGPDLDEIYDLVVEEVRSTSLDEIFISEWLRDRGIRNFFAYLQYSTYYTDLFGTQLSSDEILAMRTQNRLGGSFLGKSYRQKEKLEGYQLTETAPWTVLRITARPRYPNLPQVVGHITYVIGFTEIVLFFAVYPMRRSRWTDYSKSEEAKWLVRSLTRQDPVPEKAISDVLRAFDSSITKFVSDLLSEK